MEKNKVEDVMTFAMLVALVKHLSNGQSTYHQQLLTTAYSMLESVKSHMQGEISPDEDFTSKFNIDDEEDESV